MSSPEVIYAFRWLIRETFLQALASRILWLMFAITVVVILLCLSVSIEGGEPDQDIEVKRERGQMSLAFGALRTGLYHDARTQVHFILLLLAEWVAGAGGILLALIWTAGFLPEFLQPNCASVLLAKPAPRWLILVGKYLGVLVFVGFQVALFIVGTWLALGLRTGYWVPGYFNSIPVLLLHFAACYSFSVWLAVWTRSTVVCVFGGIVFWFICWGMNYGRHFVTALPLLDPNFPALPGSLGAMTEAGYWILPKPVDFGMILHDSLAAGEAFRNFPELETVRRMGAFDPFLAVLTSLLFAAGMLAVAARQLTMADY